MKYLKNTILVLCTILLFSNCSQSATSVFDKDPIYGQNIQYSKIVKIVDKDTVKAMFNITYLNSVDSWKWNDDKQNFLIGTFIVDSNTATQYSLNMNGLKAIKVEPLDPNSDLAKNVAFKNHWAKYHIVSFEDVDDKILTLTYIYKELYASTTFIKE